MPRPLLFCLKSGRSVCYSVPDNKGIQLPKDAKQVERWLADPASDSGLYKMWGNGIALPCAMFVMEGIAEVLKEENSNESE